MSFMASILITIPPVDGSKSILTSERFNESNYYLNIELDDSLYQNRGQIDFK